MVTRSEHRRATLIRLSDAAVALFATQGPGVTIEEIAARAGVSRRTVFRYVDGKEELAFIHPQLWFDVFDEALAAAENTPLPERLRTASQAIAKHIDADPEPPRNAFAVASEHPELARGFMRVYQMWIERIAAEVLAASSDPTDTKNQFRSRILGAAVMGMVDAVLRQWVASPPTVRFADLYDEGFETLVPLLSEDSLANS